MPKLLWVALPLLIAATLLALQAVLRRRAPARQAINTWSSLLLVGYVATLSACAQSCSMRSGNRMRQALAVAGLGNGPAPAPRS